MIEYSHTKLSYGMGLKYVFKFDRVGKGDRGPNFYEFTGTSFSLSVFSRTLLKVSPPSGYGALSGGRKSPRWRLSSRGNAL